MWIFCYWGAGIYQLSLTYLSACMKKGVWVANYICNVFVYIHANIQEYICANYHIMCYFLHFLLIFIPNIFVHLARNYSDGRSSFNLLFEKKWTIRNLKELLVYNLMTDSYANQGKQTY